MRKRNDPDKYAKVDWRSLVELDETSPTGLKWKVDVPGLKKSCAGKPAGYATWTKSKSRPPWLKKAVYYKKMYYSPTNIIAILKGETLSPTAVDFPFKEANSKWINENPHNIWWAIYKQLKYPSNKARARKSRVLLVNGDYDEDFLQDVFTDACCNFNRHYNKSKGKETTYVFPCVKSALSKLLDRSYTYSVRHPMVGDVAVREEDTTSFFKAVPAREEVPEDDLVEIKQSINEEANAIFLANESLPNASVRTSRARKVFNLSLEGKPLLVIAKELGVSKERVRQIRQEYTAKLKARLVTKHVL